MNSPSAQNLEGKTVISKLAGNYRSGKANLGKDFFAPCLKHCIQYRRAVGYFSSGALIAWAEALPRIAADAVKIQLIISPELSSEDKAALARAMDELECGKLRQIIADQIVKDALSLTDQPDSAQVRLHFLAWMVANERLVLRFAFPQHVNQPGIFHEKIGIFDFPWGDAVAFTGSANESNHGHNQNYESIDVYRSWVIADEERVKTKIEEFEEAWSGQAIGLKIVQLSQEAIKLVRDYAPTEKPNIFPEPNNGVTPQFIIPTLEVPDYRWRHQQEAVEKFLQVGHGVLEMATGTGKTRTTLKALNRLDDENKLDGIIVSTTGTDLLDQWSKEIELWAIKRPKPFRVLKHYNSHHQLESFVNNPKGAVIVISREKLASLFKRLNKNARKNLIIVHDEVHGLGSPSIREQLKGQHESFGYRLGLSATPEREYDAEGTDFIFEEIGDVFFQFSLKEAIERGILCEFDYIYLPYQLTDNDKQRLQQVYFRKAARLRQGSPMSDTELWIELSRVYKTAEQKPDVFADFLRTGSQFINSTIIFIENREFGEPILDIIHSHIHRYRTYYADDDRQNLVEFAKGNIDCLITCHRISQGIDIKNLQNVILFSSARAKLETIQRIGRCLRINPETPQKQSTVIDFVLQADEEDKKEMNSNGEISADEERCQWLSELSKVRRKE
ncbi:DEAD/DEAH box helicase family protein [Nostoc sp. UIC 10607]|uniref:DEAD/DEAH box helicase family protein n=1 Tax=Nostoc sp. UIC 10607 TaxID=3045935 RepID=UPI00399FA4AB